MPKVSMAFWAQFCNAHVQKQQQMVREQHRQAADPNAPHRDFYGRMRNCVIRGHIATQDLIAYDDTFEQLLKLDLRDPKKIPRFRCVGTAYMEFWRHLDATPFPGERGTVNIGDLTIVVNPELRIHTSYGDDQVVKLWFKALKPSRGTRQTLSYVMALAQEKEGWPPEWHMGLLDIERKTVLPSLATSTGFQEGVKQHAAAFVEMWRQMDMELERIILP